MTVECNLQSPGRINTVRIDSNFKPLPYIESQISSVQNPLKLMLDTASELNVLKVGSIPVNAIINTEDLILLKGIDSTIIPATGTLRFKILNHEVIFIIVRECFSIPFDGILGSQYFLKPKARIDFENDILLIGNKIIKFQKNHNLRSENQISGVLKWDKKPRIKALPFIKILNPPSGSIGQFMLDTGSEVNIIKAHLLPDEIYIDRGNK